eukprot:scaffold1906_cov34-Tisochrysis_lutea.AAC.1
MLLTWETEQAMCDVAKKRAQEEVNPPHPPLGGWGGGRGCKKTTNAEVAVSNRYKHGRNIM